MQYSIYDAIKAGFDKLVFVIKPEHQDVIEQFCKDIKGVEVVFVYQDFSSIPDIYTVPEDRVKPFGTVHAVLCARDAIKEPFAIINADDYYGADAFAVLYKKLQNMQDGEATMVSYLLKNTVSKNGGVTRGVCSVTNGSLTDVRETYNITVDELGVIRDSECGELSPDLLVSMNMWGFSPDVFAMAELSFKSFLLGIEQGNVKAEYALPTMVDSFVKNGQIKVDVLSTDSVWFGVTYKEDKEFVAQELYKMHAQGAYPEKLF